ncbi:MAG TPA: M48 family metallopeptidase [Chthonomonadaceae bacterium]|nr:M48 family metallopeptidase [Chthonomonadaceae bacterium]
MIDHPDREAGLIRAAARPLCSLGAFFTVLRANHRTTQVLLGLLLAALSVGLSGCRTRSFLSTRQEVSLGKEGTRQVEQQYRVDTTSPDAERVRRVGERLLPHIDKRDVPYSFKVLDSPEINAFSLPGGPVFVFRGLLDMIGDDDDALACVMGHELGHVNARHAARALSSQLATNILLTLALGNASGTTQNLAGLAVNLVDLKYSRDDEYEADRRGLSYAHFAGYDPHGLIRFFDKLQRLEKREGHGAPEWLNDHPLTKARIAKAEAIIDHGDYRFGL